MKERCIQRVLYLKELGFILAHVKLFQPFLKKDRASVAKYRKEIQESTIIASSV